MQYTMLTMNLEMKQGAKWLCHCFWVPQNLSQIKHGTCSQHVSFAMFRMNNCNELLREREFLLY